MTTLLHRMNRQEMADMLEWRFVQAGDLDFARCFAASGTVLAVLALDCYWLIGDLSRSWKSKQMRVSLCRLSLLPGGKWERTLCNKKSPQQFAESSSLSYSCTL